MNPERKRRDSLSHQLNVFILCETHAQVLAAPSVTEILALTPEAAWHCQKTGKPYRKLEDFYSESELAAQHPAMFAAELEWMDFTDRFFAAAIPEFAEARFRPALAAGFLFQTLFDEFFFAAHALNGLLRATDRPICFWPAAQPAIPDHLHPNHNVIPSILPDLAGSRAIPMSPLRTSDSELSSSPKSLKPAVRKLFRNRLMGEYRQLRHAGLPSYLAACVRSKKKGRVLVLEGGYDLDPLVLAIRRAGVAADWLTDLLPSSKSEPIDQRISKTFAEIAQQPAFWKPLEHCGLTPNPLVEASLAHWARQLIPQFWRAFQVAQTTLAKTRYDAVLAWEAGAGTLIAPMLQAAELADVPSVLYQHGSSARTSGTWWDSWLAHADKLFVYGTGTAAQLNRTYPANAKATVVPVGSARLDSLKASMTPARISQVRTRLAGNDLRPIALYVPTYFGGYGRATSDAACYPEVTYFETQQRILGLFAAYPNVRLLYKDLKTVNSLANPIADFLERNVPNSSRMPVPPRLAEAFFAVDLIIVDHVITALGEALLTDKPIIVFDPGALDAIPEAPEARELLRQRVRLATTPDEFEILVREFLKAGDFSPVVQPNSAFQASFSTQGISAMSAAAEIRRLIDLPAAPHLAETAHEIQ